MHLYGLESASITVRKYIWSEGEQVHPPNSFGLLRGFVFLLEQSLSLYLLRGTENRKGVSRAIVLARSFPVVYCFLVRHKYISADGYMAYLIAWLSSCTDPGAMQMGMNMGAVNVSMMQKQQIPPMQMNMGAYHNQNQHQQQRSQQPHAQQSVMVRVIKIIYCESFRSECILSVLRGSTIVLKVGREGSWCILRLPQNDKRLQQQQQPRRGKIVTAASNGQLYDFLSCFFVLVLLEGVRPRHRHVHPRFTVRTQWALRRYKTKLCYYHVHGTCSWGESCHHAHSLEELKPKPDLVENWLQNDNFHGGHH